MASPEHSHLLKLDRAREHFSDLEQYIQRWFNGGHAFHMFEPDPTDPGYYLLKATVDPIPASPVSLIIGDIIHNLRSSLDHLVFTLAAGFTKPLPDRIARNCQFPIVGDEDQKGTSGLGATLFAKNGSPMVQAIDPTAQAVIESLQPYYQGKESRDHPLWHLRELSNLDKHRLLLLVVTVSGGMGLTPGKSENWMITPGTIRIFETAIESGTTIARVPLRPRDPNRPMHFEVRPGYVVALGEGVFAGKPVLQALEKIHQHIEAVVFPQLEPFVSRAALPGK